MLKSVRSWASLSSQYSLCDSSRSSLAVAVGEISQGAHLLVVAVGVVKAVIFGESGLQLRAQLVVGRVGQAEDVDPQPAQVGAEGVIIWGKMGRKTDI